MTFVALGAVSMCIAAILIGVKLRKTKNPARVARVLAFISLICGIIHIACEFFPFEYTGGKGIDYIGQAIVWGAMVNAVLYSTLASYIVFAIVATIYTVKAAKAKDKHKKGWLTLLITWVCVLAIAGMVVTNIIISSNRAKKIEVTCQGVTRTVDTDGEPAVVFSLKLHNGTKDEITFLSSVYAEATQDDRTLSRAIVVEESGQPDTEIQMTPPGGDIIVKKAYKLKYTTKPVKLLCRTYNGKLIYLDMEINP